MLNSRFRLDIPAVLAVVHTEREGVTRVISFRRACKVEREVYEAWLENECDES